MIKRNIIVIISFWSIIAILGRILPHLPNATPLTALSLFSGVFLTRPKAMIVTIVTLMLSDSILAYLYHYSIFGSWSIFTYSGFLFITLMGCYLSYNTSLIKYLTTVSVLSIIYWLWTNFGVWLVSGMYTHTMSGFLTCYTTALPFLRNALFGDLIWVFVLYHLMRLALNDNLIHFNAPKFDLIRIK